MPLRLRCLPVLYSCVFVSWCLCGRSASAQTFSEQGATVLGGLNVSARSASFADIDNDGDPDLFIQTTGSSTRRLLRNNVIGAGTSNYTDVSSLLHPAGSNTLSWSAAWSDPDGDGDVDVFIGCTNTSPERGDFLRNDGASGFNDASVSAGLNDPGFAQSVAWCDMDIDLDLDLLIAMEGPEMHELYLRGPGGTYSPVGAAVGLQVPFGTKAYGAAIGDTDGDGDNDLYVSTCWTGGPIRNNFFENRLVETGTLAFVDIADTNGTQFMDNSYGAEFHDFDDDGDLDLFLVGADGEPSKILRNDGANQFTDVDTVTGHPLISNTGGDLNGGKAVDYDNDGDLDLYFHDHLVRAGNNNARLLYRNDGGWTFTNVTAAEGLSATCEDGHDSAWADSDLDGDQDLMFPNLLSWAERFFVSNASTNGNRWLYVRPRNAPQNTRAIGARLDATIHAGTPQQRTLRRDANANAGTFNQSDLPVHFGLGLATVVDELRIVWPGGLFQILRNVATNQYLTVTYAALGDCDLNGDLDLADYACLADCLTGPGSPVITGCDEFDFDSDADVDFEDVTGFQAGF